MPRTPKEQNPLDAAQIHDLVARRAYEIYEQSGYEQGRDTEHWLQAEQEIMNLLAPLQAHFEGESDLFSTGGTRVKTVAG